jgi:arylsulfatase A-like enzyme
MLTLLAVALLAGTEPRRPNVVVILADDQGWGDLSINGNRTVRTPHLDSLATDGARFERFYVQPVCSPTRAELLTGRFHPRGGVTGVTSGGERLNLTEVTVADLLRKAGYATGCFGKWHNGSQMPYHPLGRGFGTFYGFTSGHWAGYFDPPLDHDGRDVIGKGYLPDDLTTRGIDFLTQSAAAGKPFFCYLAYNTPHSPMQVPDDHWARFAGKPIMQAGGPKEDQAHTRAALAMVENLDANVGRVLAALRQRNLDRDTLVLYLTDNGPNGGRWNGGLKGRKGSTDEGGVKSPLHVRWPAAVKPGTVVPALAGAIDLLPTLLTAAGGPVPTNLDGISLLEWLTGSPPPPNRVLFQHWNGKVSARSPRFRLDAAGKLFDLDADPGQATDVTAQYPDEARRLTAAVAGYRREVLAKRPERPFPVGHPAAARTVLPARDGVPSGGVRRSAQAPNCSYFTDWAAAGRMTWDAEVLTAGRYEAVVWYTCPATEVGSAVRLQFGDVAWEGVVTEAFDPPLTAATADRVPRQGESDMKAFRPLSLGVREVPAGRGPLVLSAAKPAAARVADVRAVEFVRR